jgi:hypothetical protein
MLFGVRIANENKIVFLYRIRDYTDPLMKESCHVIRLSDDISDAFAFLNMDYDDYKEQQFKNIFEFTDWVVTNCRYLTVDIVKNISKEVEATPEVDKTDLIKMAGRFAETIKIGHVVLRDFQYYPIMMYLDLRESIVRNYFDTEEVTNQFVDLKLRHLRESGLKGKFSPKQIINWIHPLRTKPALTGMFTFSFVNYITQNSPAKFPRYLIDTDAGIVKKEVISYYYNLFPNTEAYRLYVLENPEHNEVDN